MGGKTDFHSSNFKDFHVFLIFEVNFLSPLVFLEFNIGILGNMIYKCPTFTGKMRYVAAHMVLSGPSMKSKLFFSHSITPCMFMISYMILKHY